jgi:hypothetical protein
VDFHLHCSARVVGQRIERVLGPLVHPSQAPLLGKLGLGPLPLHRFCGRLPTLAIAEPVFVFFYLAVNLLFFEHAPGDGHLIGCGHNLVGRFGRGF